MAATIDDLPFEILEIIFKELCLKDITNCSQTCLRWNYCIEALFRDKGRIAVIAGENRGWAQHTEVIDLTSYSLKYDLLPDVSERFGSVGGMVSGQPVICGGYNLYEDEYLKDCVILGHPNDKMELLQNLSTNSDIIHFLFPRHPALEESNPSTAHIMLRKITIFFLQREIS